MKVIKNQLCSPNVFQVRRTIRTMFAKQMLAQLRTGITTVISVDRCTEIRSVLSLEQPVRVPEREAEWRKGAGKGGRVAEWCRKGRLSCGTMPERGRSGGRVPEREAGWRKCAGNGGSVAGGCRKRRQSGGRVPESEAWCVPDTSIKLSRTSAPASATISPTTSRAHSATILSFKSKNLKQE